MLTTRFLRTVASHATPALNRPSSLLPQLAPAIRLASNLKDPELPQLEYRFIDAETTFSPEVAEIVDRITKLHVYQLVEMNKLLQKKLGIPDGALFGGGGFGGGGGGGGGGGAAAPQAAAAPPPEPAPEPVKEKSEFNLTLESMNEGAKFAVIKALRTLNPALNLVQAKALTDKIPSQIGEKIPKADAEKWVAALKEAGAVCNMT